MKKTRDAPERFTLCAFAAARRTEKEEGPIFHGRNSLYPKLLETGYRIEKKAKVISSPEDRHSPVGRRGRSARCHRPRQKWCNRAQGRRFGPVKISSRAGARCCCRP